MKSSAALLSRFDLWSTGGADIAAPGNPGQAHDARVADPAS
jgi:hypothetical protein